MTTYITVTIQIDNEHLEECPEIPWSVYALTPEGDIIAGGTGATVRAALLEMIEASDWEPEEATK